MSRRFAILALCAVVLATNALGLNAGIVVCLDGDRHLALEFAHVRHAESHSDGTDHHRQEAPPDAEYGDLHAALADCVDVTVGKYVQRASTSALQHPVELPALGCPVALPYLPPSLAPAALATDERSGSTAHPELARLKAIVLMV
jgi:hypothetical protein